ncbi:uncharacterized protein G2W53_020492 [Senna tora]|uniref:Uncharacterized protein n=1 Tax=Senna tora TaxID=362788 RepID=A0A834TVY2_9FABA|nr:uncharacterized protein G2W53_020492 [Senna tora]
MEIVVVPGLGQHANTLKTNAHFRTKLKPRIRIALSNLG